MSNPQVNSILEIIHQVISNLVHTFDSQNIYLDKYDPWAGTITETDFTVRYKY